MLRLCTLLVLVYCVHCAYSASYPGSWALDDLWQAYKTQYQKHYQQTGEESLRRRVWEDNVQFIQRHNLEYDLGRHTYTVGLNEYADLTPQEYRKYLLGFRPSPENFHGTRNPQYFTYDPRDPLPDNVDWRKYGYVTPIKNQGQCGSCWAFSSTGSLEGQHFRKTGRLVSLSEQNLVDCCTSNAGCNGGWMMNSFTYIRNNHGIDKEDSYPYEARDDNCRYKQSTRGAEDTGYVMTPMGDEKALKAAVAKIGPISVAIDATHQSFQLYKSGVYVEPKCSRNDTDHAVLVVGYGVYTPPGKEHSREVNSIESMLGKTGKGGKAGKNGQDYWLVKNSWGTSWGMDGYIMMARNMDNQCAIANYACYPTE